MGQELPLPTTILLAISNFLQHNGFYLLLFILLAMIGVRQLLRRETIRLRYHQVLLKIPLISTPIKMINTARYARTFGILLAASVPVLEAMNLASSLTTNLALRQTLAHAINAVREGGSIARALEQTGYFPAISLQLISSGEVSGQLEAMLEKAAFQQEEAVSRLIDTLLSLFEPALILFMGSIVLFIVLAILLPIFEINQFVS
jgi:general secretion pathway protein F